ncbi:hypothetical protein CHARACLAT_000982 [Characodon lateralis]|uniref:Uncharacterized protein n=1 Tax=Characodon lateralis TaxID=208331 RepID=A0ABU7F0G6_9TELE|nr:hypothetical protein [Characodon lateralis]
MPPLLPSGACSKHGNSLLIKYVTYPSPVCKLSKLRPSWIITDPCLTVFVSQSIFGFCLFIKDLQHYCIKANLLRPKERNILKCVINIDNFSVCPLSLRRMTTNEAEREIKKRKKS